MFRSLISRVLRNTGLHKEVVKWRFRSGRSVNSLTRDGLHIMQLYSPFNFGSQLAELCDHYGSDKGSAGQKISNYTWQPHSYTEFYGLVFGPRRLTVQTVCEIGIGTNNSDIVSNMGLNGKPGASLRVWRDYFPNAKIVGGDIDKRILFSEDRINTYHIDQTNKVSIDHFYQSTGIEKFDIIIDDGLHTFDAGCCLLINSLKHLNDGGMYIIEDISDKDLLKYNIFLKSALLSFYIVRLFRPLSKKHQYSDYFDNNLICIFKPYVA